MNRLGIPISDDTVLQQSKRNISACRFALKGEMSNSTRSMAKLRH